MRGRWTLAIVGLVLIVAGGLLAHLTQTTGGIRIEDVRFKGAKGNTMSALLYVPPDATPQIPAPGILAVQGYINSRETQDGFAIEFARRGYVVLALDAPRKSRAQEFVPPVAAEVEARVAKHKGIDARILDIHLMHDTLLLVKVRGLGMTLVEKLVRHTELPGVRMVAAVSEDVNIRDRESAIWGVFTRLDCERDILFTEQKLIGISPVYKGIMGIDAKWKEGYPKPLTMPEEVRKKVEERWDSYWR